MVILLQLKDKPNELILVRATSIRDAFVLTKTIDVPKRVYELKNYDNSIMGKAVYRIHIK